MCVEPCIYLEFQQRECAPSLILRCWMGSYHCVTQIQAGLSLQPLGYLNHWQRQMLDNRANCVRMGSDTGWSKYLYTSATECAITNALLHNQTTAFGAWNQGQPTVPQCAFSRVTSISLSDWNWSMNHQTLCSVVCLGWFLSFVNTLRKLPHYLLHFEMQHDLAGPVKLDGSFWTIGAVSLLVFILRHILP